MASPLSRWWSWWRRGLFPIFLLLLLLLLHGSAAQEADQAAALKIIKSAVGASSPNLTSWNNSLPCSGPWAWAGVTCNQQLRVVQLNMSACGLTGLIPDVLSSLTSLVSLDLSRNQLASPLPETLGQLSQMNDLNFSHNDFREPFPQPILSMIYLKELRLDNNRFSGAIPDEIEKLQSLTDMWFGNNSFTAVPASISSLRHISTLLLWGNRLGMELGMELPAAWAVWSNMTYLNLHNCNLKGGLPPEWGQTFTKLQRLRLYRNSLTGPIPDSWKGMVTSSFKQLELYDNQLSGLVPAWFLQLAKTNGSDVDCSCNFLQGTTLGTFNSSTWKGNCFDDDFRGHDQKCSDGQTCTGFLNSGGKKKGFPIAGIIGIIIAVVGLCGVLALTWWFKRSRNARARRNRRGGDADDEDWEVPQGIQRFSYKEMMKSTSSFSKKCEIGEGGFGKVYTAQLEDGKAVAVKRASAFSQQGTKEFRNEIVLLSRLHHRHLVRLEGFCDDKDEQILVYEYMKNGNLHSHLFADKDASVLNWYRRLEIALAVAQGLDYLHTFADPPVIHRDVKPSNILLDDQMIAKVSDFGISKANPEMDTHLSTRPAGTAGYLDPEYFLTRQLTTASDVYGYGVVLLELITGQVAIDHKRSEDYNLVGWVKTKLRLKEGIQFIIDPRIGSDYPLEAYSEVLDLAISCVSYERAQRPTMQVVVSTLESMMKGLTPPSEHLSPYISPLSIHKGKLQESTSQVSTGSDVTTEMKRQSFNSTVIEPR